MMGYAYIHVTGNLGQDPELRYNPNGTAICNFSVAVNTRQQDADVVNWYRVTLFGATAENADKFLAKGMPVLVSGRFQESYYTRRDGGEGRSLEIVGGDFRMLGTREQNEEIRERASTSETVYDDDDFGDVPF